MSHPMEDLVAEARGDLAAKLAETEEKFKALEAAFVHEVDRSGKVYVENYDAKAKIKELQAIIDAKNKENKELREALVTANSTNATLRSLYEQAKEERDKYRKRKDEAYTERNRVVAFAAALADRLGCGSGGVGLAKHTPENDPNWDPEWYTLIAIDIDGMQLMWHCHDKDAYLWAGFPAYDEPWNGTTTEEKYKLIEEFVKETP